MYKHRQVRFGSKWECQNIGIRTYASAVSSISTRQSSEFSLRISVAGEVSNTWLKILSIELNLDREFCFSCQRILQSLITNEHPGSWSTVLCSCLCLFRPCSHWTQIQHKHSISTRRMECVRSSCAYAYAYVCAYTPVKTSLLQCHVAPGIECAR